MDTGKDTLVRQSLNPSLPLRVLGGESFCSATGIALRLARSKRNTKQYAREDSNLRPSHPECDALIH